MLTAVVMALTLRAEFVEHHHPFLKNFECRIAVGAAKMEAIAATPFDENYCQAVTQAVEAGYITEQTGRYDVEVGFAAELDPEREGAWVGWPPVGSGKEGILQARKEKARIQHALEHLVVSANPRVPLYERVHWDPIETGAVTIGFIWLMYGVGSYVARGFFS